MKHRMPMNFSYSQNGPSGWRFYGTPGTPSTTLDAIRAGLRTSTLRKGLPKLLGVGSEVTFYNFKGVEQMVLVTGRRRVSPDMATELSLTERWTPEFLQWYMFRHGLQGGQMEQLLYRLPDSG